jgi:SnoaL-like domain
MPSAGTPEARSGEDLKFPSKSSRLLRSLVQSQRTLPFSCPFGATAKMRCCAYQEGDVDEVLSLYASDAVLVGPSGSVQGTGAIRERFRNFFEMKPAIALQTLDVHCGGQSRHVAQILDHDRDCARRQRDSK